MLKTILVILTTIAFATLMTSVAWVTSRYESEKRRQFIAWCEVHGGVPIYPIGSIDCRFPPKD